MKIIYCFYCILLFMAVPVQAYSETYRFSMIPRHSPDENHRITTLMAKYISSKTGKTIEPVITRDYSEFEKLLLSGDIDISIENPTLYVRVSSVHEVIASAVDDLGGVRVRGIVIARKGGPVKTASDIRGKRICIVGKTSTAGYLSLKLKLAGDGIAVEKECVLIEAVENKQENVIFSVLAGDADVGFIKEAAFHKADTYILPSSITVLGQGEWLPNDAFSARKSLSHDFRKSLEEAVTGINKTDDIMLGLGLSSWNPSKDSDYDPVRKALEQ